MKTTIRTMLLALASAGTLALVGFSAVPAAATDTPHLVPACSGQWDPANNANITGNIIRSTEFFKDHSAQSCPAGYSYGNNDWITVHCEWSNSIGQTWFYVYDHISFVTGWVAGSNIDIPSAEKC